MSDELNIREVVGSRLRDLRTKKGLKAVDVHTHLNIPRSTYFDYEYGKKMPSPERMRALALYLETTPDYLQGITDISTQTSNDIREMLTMLLKEKELVYEGKPISEEQAQKIITVLDAMIK